jgi:hypothetical protein
MADAKRATPVSDSSGGPDRRDTRGITMAGLKIDIFNTGYRPLPSAIPIWPDGLQATWPATTSTRISGERDGVLVDALAAMGESQEAGGLVGEDRKEPDRGLHFAQRRAAAWAVDEAR